MNGRGMGARDGCDKRYPAPEPKRTAVGGTRRGGRNGGRDEIEGGPKELRIGGSGEPSSARNRPAGKRDTTGRLHYRAPTCFLSPRRGLSPLRPTLPLSPRHPALLPESVPRVSLFSSACASRFFHPTAYIQIRFVGFLCSAWVTGPNSLLALGTHARSILCKTCDSPPDETTTFLPSNGGSAERVNFER